MNLKRRDLSEEDVRRWVELRRAGWPFARIGKDENIDRRIVARLVERYETKQIKESMTSARQQVAARLLEEHFRDLEEAADILLQIVVPPSLRGKLFWEPPNVNGLFVESLASRERLKKVYLPDASPTALDVHRESKRAAALAEALMEHQPQLRQVMDEWSQLASRYHQLWMEVENGMEIAGQFGPPARTALEEELKRLRANKTSLDKMTTDMSITSPDQQATTSSHTEVHTNLKRLLEMLENLERTFFSIEQMLDQGPLQRALLSTHCRLCPV